MNISSLITTISNNSSLQTKSFLKKKKTIKCVIPFNFLKTLLVFLKNKSIFLRL